MLLIGTVIAISIFVWAIVGLMALDSTKSPVQWIKERIDEPHEAAIAFGTVGVVVAVFGFFYLHVWQIPSYFLSDFYSNIATTFISITITVLIIDRLNIRRSALEEKKRIIQQMRSPSNEFALEAVRLAQENNWLDDGSLEGAYLVAANLQGTKLLCTNLQGARLQAANLIDAHLTFVNLRGANLELANCQGAMLLGIDLEDASLLTTNLEAAYLSESILDGANLSLANLKYTDLSKASLKGATMVRTNLEGACLNAANLENTRLGTTNLKDATYNSLTKWPKGFDPKAAGAILVEDEEVSASADAN